jgi:hypothetical protein
MAPELIGSIPPLMLKTATNSDSRPIEMFDQFRADVIAGRLTFLEG